MMMITKSLTMMTTTTSTTPIKRRRSFTDEEGRERVVSRSALSEEERYIQPLLKRSHFPSLSQSSSEDDDMDYRPSRKPKVAAKKPRKRVCHQLIPRPWELCN